MSDATATQTPPKARVPHVTRREATALRDAVNALRAIEERADTTRSIHEVGPAVIGTRLIIEASRAREAVTSFLISAWVYADADQAERALDTSWPRGS